MELEIYWTDFSKKELKNIFNYYKEKASLNVAKTIVIGITTEAKKLIKQPTIGQETILPMLQELQVVLQELLLREVLSHYQIV